MDYLKLIKEAQPFRKIPPTVIRKKFSDEKIEKATDIKNVIAYLMVGCTHDKEFSIVFMVPSRVNWIYHEYKPEQYPPYLDKTGYFALIYSSIGHLKDVSWAEFEGGDIINKRNPKPKKMIKFSKVFIKEKIKCDVETWVLKGSGTWRPFRILLKNVRSKILQNNVDIRLSKDIHDYNVFVINKKFFKDDAINSLPICVEKETPQRKRELANFIKENEGIIIGVGTRPPGNKIETMNDAIAINMFVRYNKKLFSGGGNRWKRIGNKIYSWDTDSHAKLVTYLDHDKFDEQPADLPDYIKEMILNNGTFIDLKDKYVDPAGEFRPDITYYSFFAKFEIEPKSVVFERDRNSVFLNDLRVKRHLIKPKFDFMRTYSETTKEGPAKKYTNYLYLVK